MSNDPLATARSTAAAPSAAAEFRPLGFAARGLEVVPAERLIQDWREAHQRAWNYLAALGVPDEARESLATEAVTRALHGAQWPPGSDAVAETVRALRRLLLEHYPPGALAPNNGVDEFTAWRLDAFSRGRFAAATPIEPADQALSSSTPPLQRRAMVPEHFDRRLLRGFFYRFAARRQQVRAARRALRAHRRTLPWRWVSVRRRMLLGVLVLIPSLVASEFMVTVLPHRASTWLEAAIICFFGALFGWISIGFWTATLGFFTLVGRRDRFTITGVDGHRITDEPLTLSPDARTAIVMPICEEPVERVFAGLKAIHASLAATGALGSFDLFILSDSANPSTCTREEEAWAEWCREIGGFGHIFYRRRRIRLERKSGNVADFCRRWGEAYRYMIMLDADSVMSGATLVRLVQLMERNPDAGMIQTAPHAVNRRSLLARVQQFAGRVYGPMFAAGLHYWQLGDGQYWGHNAVIRIKPFMDHCALPRLPGKPPLGGEILSHDFVEAALMGRAGWTLWLAFDLDGSYEEVPSTLLEEMKRDRRWCQGNLQHLRLLFTEGLFGAHRALFINGVLSYVSAFLWFCFLGLSTAEAILDVLRVPEYFPHGASLFPEWPVWRPYWALSLMAVTGMILFLPKVLSVLLILLQGRNAKQFGGAARLTLSVLLEILLSSLLAPIRMVFHTRFVVTNLLGRTVSWGSQTREDAETSWGEAIRHHGFDTIFASAWGGALFWLNPSYFWWLMPIIGALFLSIPVSVLASRISLGDRSRARRLFLIPEESDPPPELRALDANLVLAERAAASLPAVEQDGFVRAVVDPYVNAIHRVLQRDRRSLRSAIRAARHRLLERALVDGPATLSARQRRILLADPDLVTELHQRVWELAEIHHVDMWGRPGATR